MFGSSKKSLTPHERLQFAETLKEVNDILGYNYHGSVLLNGKLKTLEEHISDAHLKKKFSDGIGNLIKRFKKFEGHEIPEAGQLYPFEMLTISLKNNYLTVAMSDHFVFALFFGKYHMNPGTVIHVINPKISGLLEFLEEQNAKPNEVSNE